MTNTGLYPLRLERKLDYRLWGGQRLAAWLGLSRPWPSDLAESWQVYAHNIISNGPLAGQSLAEVCTHYGAAVLGHLSMPRYGHDFPLLAKFLDANARLSLQVHPDDAYAHTVEAHTGFHGKTEAWYILHAEPGAHLIYGLEHDSDREQFAAALANGELESLLHILPVQTGDVVYVPAGTLHGINEGIMLFEIQQSSDLTYRVYDYNRRDAQGRLRELHLDKALDVITYRRPQQDLIPPLAWAEDHDLLLACPYFALERLLIGAERTFARGQGSFDIWTVVEGSATVAGESLQRGESLLIPACMAEYHLAGSPTATLLRCYVPDLAGELLPALRRLYPHSTIARTVLISG